MRLPDYLERDRRQRAPFRERVLAAVADHQAKHGRSPLQKELAAVVGNPVSSVWRALRLLEDEGRIRRIRTQITLLP